MNPPSVRHCVLTAILWAAGAQSAQAVLYSVTDLGNLGAPTLPPTGTQATALNDLGDAVGYSFTPRPAIQAFLWSEATGIQDLGQRAGVGPSIATDINNAGQVIGYSFDSQGLPQAFLWSEAAGTRQLGTLGGDLSEPRGINQAGQVVGRSDDGRAERAFLWTETSGMQELGSLDGGSSNAAAINDLGQIVGSSGDFGEERAVLWTEINEIRDLGALGPGRSYAVDINNAGQVVGTSSDQAFLWTESEGMRDLDTPANYSYSTATGLNEVGEIVGYGEAPSGMRGFRWTEDEGFQDLTNLLQGSADWTIMFANDINEHGQIAATGLNALGEEHALLLTPLAKVSEPGTAAVLSIGLLMLFRNVRQKAKPRV